MKSKFRFALIIFATILLVSCSALDPTPKAPVPAPQNAVMVAEIPEPTTTPTMIVRDNTGISENDIYNLPSTILNYYEGCNHTEGKCKVLQKSFYELSFASICNGKTVDNAWIENIYPLISANPETMIQEEKYVICNLPDFPLWVNGSAWNNDRDECITVTYLGYGPENGYSGNVFHFKIDNENKDKIIVIYLVGYFPYIEPITID